MMTENRSFFSCFDCGERPAHQVPTTAPRSSSYEPAQEIKPTEDFLASQMTQLSFEERNQAINDIHCVGEELVETPEMVEKSLTDFDIAMKHQKNSTYEVAVAQNRAYVEDPNFRLKFLRANMHDVNRAVRQMVSFLEQKATHFGVEKVAQDISIDELTSEDKAYMQEGQFHISEGKDRTGRVVFYMANPTLGRCKPGNLNRIFYHVVFNILINMPTVQIKGANGIYYDVAKVKNAGLPGITYVKTIIDFITSVPIRFSAMHYCLKRIKGNLARNDFIIHVGLNSIPVYNRVRSRIHIGSDMEIQYQLKSHGIPIEFCPIDQNGNLRMDILNNWLSKLLPNPARAQGANAAELRQVVTVPARHDILLGRGKSLQTHLGNVCFREFVKRYKEEYDETPRNYRRLVLMKVIRDLKNRGIRFLRQAAEDSDEWIEPDVADVEKTVGQVFRNLRKKCKPQSA